MSSQQIASIARQIAAIAALVIGSLQDTGTVPGRYGWILQAAGAIVLAIEHYVADPSTGTTPATPVVPVKTVNPQVPPGP